MPLPALWSFASPWLLLWGAAAALPVLIHLWSRRRYFETPWAATQFLLAAIRRHQRRIQIEHWLLLAIRVLILLLLAFALAEPVVSGLAGAGDPTLQPPTHTVLVIDTSYSMAYESGGTSRFSFGDNPFSQALRAWTMKSSQPDAATVSMKFWKSFSLS